jgi:hypothetical protein
MPSIPVQNPMLPAPAQGMPQQPGLMGAMGMPPPVTAQAVQRMPEKGSSPGTRLRHSLADALMAMGAIGLGQDPFRVMMAMQDRRDKAHQYQAEQERQAKIDARSDEEFGLRKKRYEFELSEAERRRGLEERRLNAMGDVAEGLFGPSTPVGSPVPLATNPFRTMTNPGMAGMMSPGAVQGRGLAAAMSPNGTAPAAPQQGIGGILAQGNPYAQMREAIDPSERVLLELAQRSGDPDLFFQNLASAVAAPDAPKIQGGMQWTREGGWEVIPGYAEQQRSIYAGMRSPQESWGQPEQMPGVGWVQRDSRGQVRVLNAEDDPRSEITPTMEAANSEIDAARRTLEAMPPEERDRKIRREDPLTLRLVQTATQRKVGVEDPDFDRVYNSAFGVSPPPAAATVQDASGGGGSGARTAPAVKPLPARNKLVAGEVYQTKQGPARYLGNGQFEVIE